MSTPSPCTASPRIVDEEGGQGMTPEGVERPTRYGYASECRAKRGYRTKRRAEASARRQQAMPVERRERPGRLETYRCSHCGYWHVGHPVGR